MFTAEQIEEKLTLLRQQRDQHFAIYNQAVGAIALLEHLKSETANAAPPSNGKDHMTICDFEKAVGGTVEAIEPLAN